MKTRILVAATVTASASAIRLETPSSTLAQIKVNEEIAQEEEVDACDQFNS